MDTYPFTADSYVTVDDANSYFLTRLDTSVWTTATPSDQYAALCEGTRIVDRLRYRGVSSDLYNQTVYCAAPTGQLHQFPRNGDTVIPEEIRIATCECAIALLGGFDIDLEIQGLGVQSEGFASVRQSRNTNVVEAYLLAGVPSYRAWTYLLKFLVDPREVRIERV